MKADIEQQFLSSGFYYHYIDAKAFIFRAGSPPAQIFSTFHTAWANNRPSLISLKHHRAMGLNCIMYYQYHERVYVQQSQLNLKAHNRITIRRLEQLLHHYAQVRLLAMSGSNIRMRGKLMSLFDLYLYRYS